jgi:hypothetical protein
MITHNVSAEKINYSQRNNEVNPLVSCNTTSLTMATFYIPALWERFITSPSFLQYKQFPQPEDRLQQFMLDQKLDPTNHYDLVKGYNLFIGGGVDYFSVSVSFRELIDELLSGRPWVGSGTFPGFPNPVKTPLGHIVCVVGMNYEDDPYSPVEMIVDDPYGNTMNNWQGSGNDIKIPWDLFAKWMKPLDDPKGLRFWAHRFKVS